MRSYDGITGANQPYYHIPGILWPDGYVRRLSPCDGGELAYALQETIDTAQAGLPLPNGTVLVLEIYGGGALTDYFVMEKGRDWGLDFVEEGRNGDWHFQ
ncbi:MAG: hypothetical protein JWP26_2216 [Devosia sp.]|uniref:hypothetical protein n=1 Tax=Devosia sp. TaxID=1871048 RepID=UPI00260FF30C|nr:hypothetical protein [Devosia sp.]MDB5587246.1 hypothetical protein [Devosia sp.]